MKDDVLQARSHITRSSSQSVSKNLTFDCPRSSLRREAAMAAFAEELAAGIGIVRLQVIRTLGGHCRTTESDPKRSSEAFIGLAYRP
jgi:hypothetical protein